MTSPHPSIQTVPCSPPVKEGGCPDWSGVPFCPAGMPCEDAVRCQGLNCASFLQIDNNRGLCGMVPGMLDYVLRMVKV